MFYILYSTRRKSKISYIMAHFLLNTVCTASCSPPSLSLPSSALSLRLAFLQPSVPSLAVSVGNSCIGMQLLYTLLISLYEDMSFSAFIPAFYCKYAHIQYLHSRFKDLWEAFKEEVNKKGINMLKLFFSFWGFLY